MIADNIYNYCIPSIDVNSQEIANNKRLQTLNNLFSFGSKVRRAVCLALYLYSRLKKPSVKVLHKGLEEKC